MSGVSSPSVSEISESSLGFGDPEEVTASARILDDFCEVVAERYFVANCDFEVPGLMEGQFLHISKDDVIYRTCHGVIIEGLLEGVVASGKYRGRVGTFNVKYLTSAEESEVREKALPRSAEGAPEIVIKCAGDENCYERVWDSFDSTCKPYHSIFWRVKCPPGYHKFSDVVEKTKNKGATSPNGPVRKGVYIVETPKGRLASILAKPIGFELVWSSRRARASHNTPYLCIWKIVPPIGFVSLGYLCSNSLVPPDAEEVVCVSASAVVKGMVSVDHKYGMLWSSRGMQIDPPVNCWLVESLPSQSGFTSSISVGGFYANPSPDAEDVPYSGDLYLLQKLRVQIDSRGFPRTKSILEGLDGQEIDPVQYLEKIIEETAFDRDELNYLFVPFFSNGTITSLDKKQFATLIPGIDPALLESLFQAIDIDGDGSLNFYEYAVALSTMSRGTPEERVQFSFMVCDLDGSGFVEREELKSLSGHLQKLASHVGGKQIEEKYENSDMAIDHLFQRRAQAAAAEPELEEEMSEEIKEKQKHYLNQDFEVDEEAMKDDVDSDDDSECVPHEEEKQGGRKVVVRMDFESALSYQEFCERAKTDASFLNCFGLFDLFYDKIVVPVEAKLYGESLNRKEISGWLEKEKGEGVLNKALQLVSAYDKRYFICRGGHLKYMKKENSETLNIVNLTDAKVLAYKEDFAEWFRVETPVFLRSLRSSNKNTRKMWTQAIRNNIFTNQNRYASFAPVRDVQHAQWFINGFEYFEHLLKVLPRAKHRVFISDWAFAPLLYVVRENPLKTEHRVDQLLLQLAERGVEVYVLVWYASSLGFDLRAKWVISYLNSLSDNIHAAAHPPWTPVIWSHHQKFFVIDDQVAYVGGVDLCFNRFDDEKYLVTDPLGLKFPGRDYNNLSYYGCGETNGPPEEELVDRKRVPRMAWHDIHMVVEGHAAMDVAYNFIQRWNHSARENSLPTNWFLFPESVNVTSERPRMLLPEETVTTGMCQVIRSVGYWSAGQTIKEDSILRAYEALIRSSKRYIYIENQYFISSITRACPRNNIVRAIYERIKYAIVNKQTFRVIVILPVAPAGDLFAASTRYVMKYVYKTINRDGNRSLMARLKKEFPEVNISDYISFHSLRNYGYVESAPSKKDGEGGGQPIPATEQVYVHAKLMIVDDLHCIIGSANINDRSMLGDRDSELCIVTTDNQENCKTVRWNGKDVVVGNFAHSLRTRLYRDYLGLERDQEYDFVTDPISPKSFEYWQTVANTNTDIYNDVFPNLPDNCEDLEKLKELASQSLYSGCVSDPKKVDRLGELRGFLINFPLRFLIKENLSPKVGDAELLVPRVTFV
eukprot:CAMPEP_0201482708 /NCGR_PEP_ID=MMETSP0151_2-20130828/6972_1 /ASSEMBLY_ACC=CAM_ASM_000257 /TAXON_ID=200890 /ORGANISM="Paramoeba atlantica, Strain 621/1 / CCAP 1560/9" /LENGTH=1333 /DNA_ID=CAMNT_0047865521 /DNA_START=265 /DNA_END=4266 /DNA_ORIENTATION=+